MCIRDSIGARPQRVAVVEVAADRLGPALAHSLRGALRASEGAHLPALRAEALDQSASDEARPAGDERARQRFCRSSPHCQPLHGLCEISLTLAFPWLSRVMRKLVQAMLLVVVVSMNVPSGFAIETR